MIAYADLRTLHVLFAIISVSGFALRGALIWVGSPILQRRWVRILPHINDTLLLAAAICLAMMSGQYPWTASWLAAKIVGLLAYIALGVAALRPRFSKPVRVAAWVAALICFAWIASVARLRNPAGFLLYFLIALDINFQSL